MPSGHQPFRALVEEQIAQLQSAHWRWMLQRQPAYDLHGHKVVRTSRSSIEACTQLAEGQYGRLDERRDPRRIQVELIGKQQENALLANVFDLVRTWLEHQNAQGHEEITAVVQEDAGLYGNIVGPRQLELIIPITEGQPLGKHRSKGRDRIDLVMGCQEP